MPNYQEPSPEVKVQAYILTVFLINSMFLTFIHLDISELRQLNINNILGNGF